MVIARVWLLLPAALCLAGCTPPDHPAADRNTDEQPPSAIGADKAHTAGGDLGTGLPSAHTDQGTVEAAPPPQAEQGTVDGTPPTDPSVGNTGAGATDVEQPGGAIGQGTSRGHATPGSDKVGGR